MAAPLPPHPNLDWLKKTARQRLETMRLDSPRARLAEALLAVAREHGFASWRALKAHVDSLADQARKPDDAGAAHFLRLVGAGRVDEMRAMLERTPDLANAVGPHPFWGGRPQPLHVALERGRRVVIDLLLAHGADVNGVNDGYDHWSPLMLAAGRPELAAELIARGARVGVAEALLLGDDVALNRLIESGRLPLAVPGDGSWLSFARTAHAIERLLALGERPDRPDRWGSTAIDAFSRLDPAGGRRLLDHLRRHGTSPTPEALARIGDIDGLAAAAQADPTVAARESVAFAAADASQTAVVEWLLARGASPRARTGSPSRHTLLHAAAWHGNLALARLLVEAGADVHARDDEHDGTPLGWAEASIEVTGKPGCEAVVDYLREVGAAGASRP